ncbi:MAG TPA: amidohydrolase [Planctomycetaceae bacterium]|nr:amidohydrolase [Planctomycetaceae bacterium]HQZ67887.1 amidohydrolase [Planctomycetaceae bacterium]HRA88715.1 amidohydrolase [Planctomycetaceae bacterium]
MKTWMVEPNDIKSMNPGSTGTGWRVSPADIERIMPFELLLDRIADERGDAWIAERRFLHTHPEPSGEEIQTTQFIADRLSAIGISPQIPKRGVGVIADLKIGTPAADSPIVAVRADIDGLRMQDRKSVDYASRWSGVAHACGHDVHTTVVLATAELLASLEQRLPESELPSAHLRFIFQPAEETAQGALWMVEDGALQGVTAILGLHVDPTIPVGKVGIRYGVLTAQVDEVLIKVSGRGGHAARPQHTSDPIGTAAMLVSALYQAIPRRVDSLTPLVFTVGSIHGGTASNVIPDQVEITGTLRSIDRHTRDGVLNNIRQICTGIAAATDNTIDVVFRNPLGSVTNDVTVTSAIEAASIQVLGGENIVIIDRPSMGGEDFAVYIEHVRGAQFRLGCAGPDGDWPLLHSPIFDIEEEAIPFGARIMARTAMMLAMIGPESAACQ